jgi:hypothetical protein
VSITNCPPLQEPFALKDFIERITQGLVVSSRAQAQGVYRIWIVALSAKVSHNDDADLSFSNSSF